MNIRSVLLAATVLALPAAAIAQPVTGLYVGGGVGAKWTQNVDVKSLTVGGVGYSTGGATLNDAGGLAAGAMVGWGFGNGLRVELEGDYGASHFTVHSSGGTIGGGDLNNYGVFVNGLYDFNVGWPVTPYVGAGVGYQWVGMRGGHFNVGPASIVFNNNTEGSFAAQGILGMAVPLTAVPGLSLTAEYHFIATLEDVSYSGGVAGTPIGVSTKIGDTYTHAILIGARYAFNAAPPPPPPMAPMPAAAPAPAPARTYLVFFDWDKADLSARAHQIIAEAAQNSTHVQLTKIEVSGYADRTGTAQYNMVLSRRRADNVAAELVKDGVPKNVIAIQAFGDTHLLVPTGPGVREPQNRRVEIDLQ